MCYYAQIHIFYREVLFALIYSSSFSDRARGYISTAILLGHFDFSKKHSSSPFDLADWHGETMPLEKLDKLSLRHTDTP